MRNRLYPEPIFEQYPIAPPGGVVISKKILLSLDKNMIYDLANKAIKSEKYEDIDGVELCPLTTLNQEIVWSVRSFIDNKRVITLMYTSEI